MQTELGSNPQHAWRIDPSLPPPPQKKVSGDFIYSLGTEYLGFPKGISQREKNGVVGSWQYEGVASAVSVCCCCKSTMHSLDKISESIEQGRQAFGSSVVVSNLRVLNLGILEVGRWLFVVDCRQVHRGLWIWQRKGKGQGRAEDGRRGAFIMVLGRMEQEASENKSVQADRKDCKDEVRL
jgi:hypothetical protein